MKKRSATLQGSMGREKFLKGASESLQGSLKRPSKDSSKGLYIKYNIYHNFYTYYTLIYNTYIIAKGPQEESIRIATAQQ